MILKRLNTGMLGSNCYIAGDRGEGVIIDPGAGFDETMEAVAESGLSIKYILLTHSHIDHICSVDALKKSLGAKVAIHSLDAELLGDAWKNGSRLFGLDDVFGDADILLEDGQNIDVGGLKFEILHTPGHTPGGICIKVENIVFTGDTLFRMSVGRTDLGAGSQEDLMDSIKNKLFTLEDDTLVYPGHGTSTTIEYERKHNPYI